jgi:hypothetical protein
MPNSATARAPSYDLMKRRGRTREFGLRDPREVVADEHGVLLDVESPEPRDAPRDSSEEQRQGPDDARIRYPAATGLFGGCLHQSLGELSGVAGF